MGISFIPSNNKLPGLNFEAPPGIRDLEYLFDQIFASEQRQRLQLAMGHYRGAGPSYGIVDEEDPKSALSSTSRSLVLAPNSGNPFTIDILPGVAVTKSGNVIALTERLFGLQPADGKGQNVVLLEYIVADDPSTTVVTAYNTVEAVRREVAPAYDAIAGNPQLVKIVTLDEFNDATVFTEERLNDVVVLGIVSYEVATNSSTGLQTVTGMSIDMTNATNAKVRPWFSTIDQEHRAWIGTGSEDVPHRLSYNDLGGGALTLYQQLLQHGGVITRDLDVPGCPGKLCSELVDNVRVFTDSDGSVTGTSGRRYVRLQSYPIRILGARGNKLDSSNKVVEDTSVSAPLVAVELIPSTNILMLGRQGATNEGYDSTRGFTVYYTDSDCVRPPALPHDIMLVANDIIQFQTPDSTREEYVTGGRIYAELPTTQYTVGSNGPVPKNYRLWLDNSRQFVQSPQVLVCAKLLHGSKGVGTAIQDPQFDMLGPARIRAALWNAVPSATLDVQVLLSGLDRDGKAITETLIFSGTAANALPRQIAWDQSTVGQNGEAAGVFQVSTQVFSQLDSWKIKQTTIDSGDYAHVQLWADIEPTITPVLDDALPVCQFLWNGQSVSRVRDLRPITGRFGDPRSAADETMHATMMALEVSGRLPIASEDFKSPVLQDNVLSKRSRHSSGLNTVAIDETLTAFSADGTHSGDEWYYSQAIVLPASSGTLQMVLFGDAPVSMRSAFGSEAVVEYQLANTGTPTVFGSWLTLPMIGSNPRLRSLVVAGAFKVRFRIAGKKLSGYSVAFV